MAPTRMILCDDSPSYFGSELKCNSILTMRGKEVKVILSSPCLVQDGRSITQDDVDDVCTASKRMHYFNLPFQKFQNVISSFDSFRQASDRISELILRKRRHEMKEIRESFSDEMKKATSPSSYMLADEVACERPIIVLGMNISYLSRRSRFIMCAGFVYSFSLLYAFLQELLSVHLLNRKLGLFLAMWQMMICTALSYIFRRFNVPKHPETSQGYHKKAALLSNCSCLSLFGTSAESTAGNSSLSWRIYFWLSILRAIEIGMANLSMQYINYPAKTLMKSSRVIFTIFFGLVVLRRRYPIHDYIIAALTVTGLGLFLHADSTSSAIFQSMGVIMLSTSLMCDGAIVNLSESLMQKYDVGHDEYLFRLSSVAAVAITFAAACRGDLTEGASFLMMRGTYEEIELGVGEHSIWTSWRKIVVLILFCTAGFLGSSCAAFITREYGALTMSITSTARKATTLFISFVLFKNVCTWEHAWGIFIFMSSLVLKTLISNGESSFSRWKGYNTSSSLKATHEVSC